MSLFERYKAVQFSNTGFSFDIQSADRTLAIHPLVWLKYTVKLADTFDGTTIGNLFADSDTLRFRQGWACTRALTQFNCTINDKTTLSHQPRLYLDPLQRIYLSNQACETQTSGGTFDTGSCSTTNTDIALYDGAGTDHNPFFNQGAFERSLTTIAKFIREIKYQVADPANLENRDVAVCNSVDLWEPVPITPFFLMSKFSNVNDLSYIRRLQFSASLNLSLAFEYPGVDTEILTLENIEAHVQYIPYEYDADRPMSLSLYRESVIQITRDPDKLLQTHTIEMDVHNENSLLYLYIRPNNFTKETETFGGIRKLIIKTPNHHAELYDRVLYDMYIGESINKDVSFDEWSSHKSVCILNMAQFKIRRRVKFTIEWEWHYPALVPGSAVNKDTTYTDFSLVTLYAYNTFVHV